MKKPLFVFCVMGVFLLVQALAAQTWEKTKRLTWNYDASFYPEIAVDSSDKLHVVWQDYTPGNAEIHYKWSTNAGGTWGSNKRLTWTPEDSIWPKITVDSSNMVHVVYLDYHPGNYDVYYRNSTNGGGTWGAARRISWTSGSLSPRIAVDSANGIHIIWSNGNPGNYEIYYKKSTNGGTSWTTKRLTWTSVDSYSSNIAIDSNDNILVVWREDNPSNDEAYFKKSTNGGTSWTTKRLTWTSGNSWSPNIAIDSNDNIHLVWTEQTTTYKDIYYKRSTNGGTSWTTKRLTWTSGYSSGTGIAVDSNDRIHVVWQDKTPGNYEIYYKRSAIGGTTWGGSKRLTWNSSDSSAPEVGIDSSNNIHVVWHEEISTVGDIYYKKGIQ
jgi:hypothetical protein